MAEFKFEREERAQMVVELIEKVEVDEQTYPLNYYVDAAHDFDNVDDALNFLNKECAICLSVYPIHEVRLLR